MLKGYIEGYYGRFFSEHERCKVLNHMGKLNMDFYLYGPKEDPFHRVSWEKPYPVSKEKILKVMATTVAHKRASPHSLKTPFFFFAQFLGPMYLSVPIES